MEDFISPSKLNTQVKWLLEISYPLVYVKGEVSEWNIHTNGHIYFSVKDSKALVRGILFSSFVQPIPHLEISIGDYIFIAAKISLYEKNGSYQLLAQNIYRDGFGVLNAEFEKIKTQLEKEGLFDQDKKQTIPSHPSLIGIIASLDSAALQDFLTLAKNQYPNIPILIFPVLIQGHQALEQIFEALTQAQTFPLSTLLITRGGGEPEELNLFNNERLARLIAQYPIPVVSAIGHEQDTTILDLVADQRASTPSHAASIILPNKTLLQHAIYQEITQCQENFLFALQEIQKELNDYHPQSLIQIIQSSIQWYKDQLYFNQLQSFGLELIEKEILYIKNMLMILEKDLKNEIELLKIQIEKKGKQIVSIEQIQKQDRLILYLYDGKIEVQVLDFQILNRESENEKI